MKITDTEVLRACWESSYDTERFSIDILAESTGQPYKVCLRAMERTVRKGLIDYGVSIKGAWLTKKGRERLNNEQEVHKGSAGS